MPGLSAPHLPAVEQSDQNHDRDPEPTAPTTRSHFQAPEPVGSSSGNGEQAENDAQHPQSTPDGSALQNTGVDSQALSPAATNQTPPGGGPSPAPPPPAATASQTPQPSVRGPGSYPMMQASLAQMSPVSQGKQPAWNSRPKLPKPPPAKPAPVDYPAQIAALQTEINILKTEVNISRSDLTRALETIHSQQATIAATYGNSRPGPPGPPINGQTPLQNRGQTAPPSGSDAVPIDRALREYCNVPGRWFFVASLSPEGDVKTFAPVPSGSSSILPQEMVAKFFSEDQFKRACLKQEDERSKEPAAPEHAQLLPPPEGFFPTWDELFAAVRDFAGKQGYGVLHSMHGKRLDGTPCRYAIRCEKSGTTESKSTGKRKRETKKTGCPFDAVAVKYAGSENWKFRVNQPAHNHPPYGSIRHVKKAEMELARPLIERGVTAERQSRVIWEDIVAAFPGCSISKSDVNNMAAAYRRKMGLPPVKRPGRKSAGGGDGEGEGEEEDEEDAEEDAMGDVENSVLQQLGNQGRYSQPQAPQQQQQQTQQTQGYGQLYGQDAAYPPPGYR